MDRKKPEPGEIYTHFKGRKYQILHLAIHTETEEELVIYQAMYGTRKIYARPLAMFLSPVDREKYPDVEQHNRFELTGRAKSGKRADDGTAFVTHSKMAEDGDAESDQTSLIFSFLDCESNEEKLRFLYQHRAEVTDSFLMTAGESVGCTVTEKTTELRFEEVMNYLRMKIKYETGRLR